MLDTTGVSGPAATWAGLRALYAVTVGEGLVGYVAGDLGPAVHILDVAAVGSRSHYRHLIRDEPGWWSVGVADVMGVGDVVLEAMAEPVPELITPAEAAGLLPAMDRWGKLTGKVMSVDGIEHNVTRGSLYPLYSHTPSRTLWLFAAQVAAEAARRRNADDADELAREWFAIRSLVPDAIRPEALRYDVSARPSVDPLPLPALKSTNRRPMPTRWTDAMMLADKAGLVRFIGPVEDGSLAYRTEVPGIGRVLVRRDVPGEHVLAWLLGVADGLEAAGHGECNADRVAYRAWLG